MMQQMLCTDNRIRWNDRTAELRTGMQSYPADGKAASLFVFLSDF